MTTETTVQLKLHFLFFFFKRQLRPSKLPVLHLVMVRLKLKLPQLYTEYVRSTATIVVLPGA